ncbi:MAG: hypothetical protein N0E48_10990, partial [Candidatus Thiodiazotropha endolucinida]|nr:hypothetical protein [Candidatus Thiodiazotropha taylori]MCW4343866.1 hypothetical protein [Candidatus Thiodiazotropha endolucinida]
RHNAPFVSRSLLKKRAILFRALFVWVKNASFDRSLLFPYTYFLFSIRLYDAERTKKGLHYPNAIEWHRNAGDLFKQDRFKPV